MSDTTCRRVRCDRCRAQEVEIKVGDLIDPKLRGWARLSYRYQTGDLKELTWDLCPNCRLLIEKLMIDGRLLGDARRKGQFDVEASLAALVEQSPEVREARVLLERFRNLSWGSRKITDEEEYARLRDDVSRYLRGAE